MNSKQLKPFLNYRVRFKNSIIAKESELKLYAKGYKLYSIHFFNRIEHKYRMRYFLKSSTKFLSKVFKASVSELAYFITRNMRIKCLYISDFRASNKKISLYLNNKIREVHGSFIVGNPQMYVSSIPHFPSLEYFGCVAFLLREKIFLSFNILNAMTKIKHINIANTPVVISQRDIPKRQIIKTLSLTNVNSSQLSSILTQKAHIERLSLEGLEFEKAKFPHQLVSNLKILDLKIQNQFQLEKFNQLDSISELNLEGKPFLMGNIKFLEEIGLGINRLQNVKKLELINFPDLIFEKITELKLEELIVKGKINADQKFHKFLTKQTLLKKLIMYSRLFSKVKSIEKVLKTLTHLETLGVHLRTEYLIKEEKSSNHAILNLVTACPSLKYLNLSLDEFTFPKKDAVKFINVVEGLKNLKRLNIMNINLDDDKVASMILSFLNKKIGKIQISMDLHSLRNNSLLREFFRAMGMPNMPLFV